MLTALLLALRNVRRNRSRTLLTLGAIGFGVMMTLFLGGFAQGFQNLLVDDTIKSRTGAIQVHRKGYFDVKDNQPLDFDLEQGGALEARIRAVPGVTGVTPRLIFSGLVNNGSSSATVVVTGMDAATMREVLPGSDADLTGQPLSADAPRGGVMGMELANALDAPFGTTLVVQAAAKSGRQNALDLDVRGHLETTNAYDSKSVIYVPLSFAQEMVGLPGRVTEYALSVKDRDDVAPVAAALQAALGAEYEVQTWRELRPNVAEVTVFVRGILTAISLIFLIIAVFGVVNTMLMSVLERTREIGTMMAVGVKRWQVLALFLLEATVQALIGGVVGGAIGWSVVVGFAMRGGVGAVSPGTKVIKYVVPVVPPGLAAIAIGASLLGALLAALYPAWRASRLNPVDALRGA